MPSLHAVKACIFDAYGTLFDVNAAARTLTQEIGPQWEAFSDLWRQKQLAYSWLRSLTDQYADFRQVTAEALDYAIEANGLDPSLASRLMALYDQLEAYPEVPALLKGLKAKGYRTGILSNGSPQMLASAIESAAIGALLEQTLSVDSLQRYKPLPAVYQLVVDQFGIPAAEVLFFSSNGWDIAGAAAFGFQTVWVNRSQAPRDRLPSGPDHEVSDLTQALRLLD
jgi:2-haloacid dehalogenase